MLKLKTFSFACFLLGSSLSFGQSHSDPKIGFYGKRVFMQFGVGFHHNTLLKIASSRERVFRKNDYYDNYRKQITKDWFNYSIYGTLGIVLKENRCFSLDFQYYSGDIFYQNYGSVMHDNVYPNTGYYFTSKYDVRVKYNTIRFMPRIEFGSRGSNTPVGLNHVIGIGVEASYLKSGNYRAITSRSSSPSKDPDSAQVTNDHIYLSDRFVFNVTLLYGMEYRLPLSRSIAWNFGAYLHANIPALFPSYIPDKNNVGIDETGEMRQLARYRFQNLFSLRTGIVLLF